MDRRAFIAGILSLLAAPLAAEAQPAGKVPRIGWLRIGRPGSSPWELEGFQRGLRELGYVEGQSIVIEYRHAGDNLERFTALAAELVRLQPDVLVAALSGARRLRQTTTTIPIVFVGGDPVQTGLVASLARPGGNITGFSMMNREGLDLKRLELLKETVPSAIRVGILVNPVIGLTRPELDAHRAAGQTLGTHRPGVPGGAARGVRSRVRSHDQRACPGGRRDLGPAETSTTLLGSRS